VNAPVIWIVLPIFIGVLLFFLRRWQAVSIVVALLMSVWLAWVAWKLTFGESVILGKITLRIAETYSVLGREFILSEAERPFIAFLYMVNVVWLAGAYFARPSSIFASYAMITVALLTAALAVEPFLYAALIIETITLFSIPILAPPGQRSRRGVLRFLAFQTIGMPFILFTGWMLAGVEATPGNVGLVFRAGILMAAGFAFMLAIFPFHSWIPMLSEESHPYVVAFLLFMLQGVVSLFGIGFLERYVWLRESQGLFNLLRVIGVLMVLVGGWWAAIDRHLGRGMGYAVVMETGWSLLAIGLASTTGVLVYFWLMIPRAVSYVLWAVSLSRLRLEAEGSLRLDRVVGHGYRFPLTVVGLLVAQFSLAGLPLLVGFPVRLTLWENLAGNYPSIALASVFGSIGLLVSGLRCMLSLFDTRQILPEKKPVEKGSYFGELKMDMLPIQEQRSRELITRGIFTAYILVILIVGVFPQRFFPMLDQFIGMFPQFGK